MYNTYQLILCALLSSFTSAAVSNILWLRHHRRVRSLLGHEAEKYIQRFREHPEDYTVTYEESDGGLYVTVSLKDPEGGDA